MKYCLWADFFRQLFFSPPIIDQIYYLHLIKAQSDYKLKILWAHPTNNGFLSLQKVIQMNFKTLFIIKISLAPWLTVNNELDCK